MDIKKNQRKNNGDSVKRLLDSTAILDRAIHDAPVAGLGMFLREQLTFIIPEILKQEFPGTSALKIFEADNSGTWDKQILTRLRTQEGRHTPTAMAANETGKITVGTSYNSMLVVDYAGSSDYDYKSLQKAKALGENIDSDIIEAHNNSYQQIADQVAFLGITDVNTNVYTDGIANSSLVNAANKINATADWETATGNEIVEDLIALRRLLYGIGGGNDLWMPNTVVCSPAIFVLLSSKNFSITGFTTSETVMSYCQKQYGMTFYSSKHLAGLSTTPNKDRILMFNNDRRAVVYHIPRPLEFYPLETHAGKFQLTSAFSIAGVNLRQASTVGYLDLI